MNIDITSEQFYPGPNRHTLHSAYEAIVHLGSYGSTPTCERQDFVSQILTLLPGLHDHVCSLGVPGGFVTRLQQGTYLGHVMEHVALEFLYLAGEEGHYGKTREIPGQESVRIVFESETEEGGRLALQAASQWVKALWDQERILAWSHALSTLLDQIREYHLGPSTRAIINAAKARDIPVWRLTQENMVRLGQGIHQKRIMAALSDETSAIAVDVCQDKELTKQLLQRHGIMVPRGRSVKSPEDAIAAAQELGYPVVVKPQRGHQGQGVSLNVQDASELSRAYAWAAEHSDDGAIMIEEQVPGNPYRILVVGNKVVAASLRWPPSVTGDGIHSIDQLIEQENRNPLRGLHHTLPLSPIVRDQGTMMALIHQHLTLHSIPDPGQKVWLRESANLSSGGEAVDVTDDISRALAWDMVRTAQIVGLDIAGIDIVTPNLSQDLRSSGGMVIEVNAAPGLRMHVYPSHGQSRPVGEAIIQHLFPHHNGRIPVCAITGTNGKTTVTRMLAHIWRQTGRVVGMTSTGGIMIGNHLVQSGDLTGPWSAQVVLGDPTVEVAILETARGGMARYGLGFSDLDVAVVTNIGPDHLGQDGIDTLEDLTHLKALLVDVVRPGGTVVLNADDPYVVKMAQRTPNRIIWFSTNKDQTFITEQVAEGHGAVVLSHGYLVYRDQDGMRRIIGNRVLPASWHGRAEINVKNAMAAAAAAIAMGLDPAFVGKSLSHFAVEQGANPGRLELIHGEPVDVLLDYAHNAPALEALGQIVKRLRYGHVRTVLGLPGDRRNQDLEQAIKAAAAFSGDIVVREDADLRGRKPGEMTEFMTRTLQQVGFNPGQLMTVPQEREAVIHAVKTAPPHSLVVVLFENYQTVKDAVCRVLQPVKDTEDVS
ncbi:MAG: cyanophycin synthetase [Sulfobacillus thermosulfidooxidans]|uniref:Cyanophycin synthetase n=1 Tax=Sulfobacillus thermosulfidooxidans TaxID=28034 RepID=A0A2T2X2U5_SULTH|nr:MAG: cyanophycin synthetase [Sulfobacillus thermosulfidooxidans]